MNKTKKSNEVNDRFCDQGSQRQHKAQGYAIDKVNLI